MISLKQIEFSHRMLEECCGCSLRSVIWTKFNGHRCRNPSVQNVDFLHDPYLALLLFHPQSTYIRAPDLSEVKKLMHSRSDPESGH